MNNGTASALKSLTQRKLTFLRVFRHQVFIEIITSTLRSMAKVHNAQFRIIISIRRTMPLYTYSTSITARVCNSL